MIENILLEELPNIYRYFKNAADNAATGKQADKMKLYWRTRQNIAGRKWWKKR